MLSAVFRGAVRRAPVLRMGLPAARMPVRAMSAEQELPVDFQDLDFKAALEKEIDYEQEAAEGDEFQVGALQADFDDAFPGFKVDVCADQYRVRLHRALENGRSVRVEIDLCNQEQYEVAPDAEEGASPEDAFIHALNGMATFERVGHNEDLAVLFTVPIEEGAIPEVTNMVVVPKGVNPMLPAPEGQDSDRYSPIDWSDLDVGLQASAINYLSEAGVDQEFADAVRAIADRKEQFEYVRWLQRVHSFVAE